MNKSSLIFRCRGLVNVFALVAIGCSIVFGQDRGDSETRRAQKRGQVRPATIPVTIRRRDPKSEREVSVDFIVREDGEMQDVLSIRRPNETPLTLAVLMQDDLVSSVSNESRGIADFVRRQPLGTRVMVGYIRAGSLEVRRKFTGDLEKVADSVRPPLGIASAAPFNPYVEIIEALKRFDSQPTGRRSILVVSDGLDVARGLESASPSQSLDLQHAIREAQRRGVAIYSIYAPAVSTAASNNQVLVSYAQSSLEQLSNETGGHAYFQGTGAPISFDRFLSEIDTSFSRQLAVTYLSTHVNKGFHRLEIKPQDRSIELRHPAGYPR